MNQISTLGLAYIGDGVFELLIRAYVCRNGVTTAKNLHRTTVEYVNAVTQAGLSQKLLPLLTDEERAVWLRGRNTKSTHTPKGASDAEYHFATALECVFGWLYLNNRSDRIERLFNILIESC